MQKYSVQVNLLKFIYVKGIFFFFNNSEGIQEYRNVIWFLHWKGGGGWGNGNYKRVFRKYYSTIVYTTLVACKGQLTEAPTSSTSKWCIARHIIWEYPLRPLRDHIISLRGEVRVDMTTCSLTPHYLLKCLYQARKVSGHVFVW